jgi:hypothetical protein
MLYRGLIAALLLFVSSSAFSQEYSWLFNFNVGPYKSATEGCAANGWPDAVNWYYGAAYGICQRARDNGDGTTSMVQGPPITRSGDSCPVGTTYNAVTGGCDSPAMKDGDLCEDQQGHSSSNPMIYSSSAGKCVALTDADDKSTCSYFGGKGETTYSVSGVLNSGGEAVAPPTFAGQMGCEVATISTSDCTINVKGAISCNVTAKFTGNVANTNLPDVRDNQCEPGACPPTDKATTVEDKPCVMANGSCTQETDKQTTGNQSCGSMNGNYICVTSKPTSDGTKVDTTVKSEVQADGTVKTTKTDNATKTTCTDVNTCTTKTSSTTTTTTTNKDGQTTSTGSTCKGSCGSNGTGLESGGSGNGSGDGDGEGDGTASTSDDCKVPPACDGDVYLCSILRQEALDSCAERALPTDKEKADFQQLLDKQKQALDANQKEMDDKVSSLVSQFQSSTGSSSSAGKCFEDKTFTVSGHSFVLPFSQVCPMLEWFRYALLAVAYLIALRIVSKEI